MIERLLPALRHLGLEPTPLDVADALWLAHHLEQAPPSGAAPAARPRRPSVPGEPLAPLPAPTRAPDASAPTSPSTNQASTSGGAFLPGQAPGRSAGLPFRSPTVPALPDTLRVARAMRPLMRRVPTPTQTVLDVEATIRRIADEGIWEPVLRPARERWLDVALVADAGASMAIWQQMIAEFRALLARHGAFRDVRAWSLVTDDAGGALRLYAGLGVRALAGRPHALRELVDPRGRRLVLLLSDCVSPAWHTGAVAAALARWGRYGPASLVQLLPARLWPRSALAAGREVQLRAPTPGAPNRQLDTDAHRRSHSVLAQAESEQSVAPSAPPPAITPVTTLDADALADWARAITSAGGAWAPGFVLPTRRPAPKQLEPAHAAEQPSADALVKQFWASASPPARDLACYLADIPISLPVMRLVQRAMQPEHRRAHPAHLAEIFLSGLLVQRGDATDVAHPDQIEYSFVEGVRPLLRNRLLLSDAERVRSALGAYISGRIGRGVDFPALLANLGSAEGAALSARELPFATLTAQALRELGGEFARWADTLEQGGADRVSEAANVGNLASQQTGNAPSGVRAISGALHADLITQMAQQDAPNNIQVPSSETVAQVSVPEASQTTPLDRATTTIATEMVDAMAAALIACSFARDPAQRAVVLDLLVPGADIRREADALTQMQALVQLCALRQGGLTELVDTVRYLEGDSEAAGEVERQVQRALEGATSQDEIDHQRRLLAQYRRNLRNLLEQAAEYGGESAAPLSVMNSVRDARAHIAEIKAVLRAWGAAVADEANDDVEHMLNAWIEGYDGKQPLNMGQTYQLFLAIGPRRTDSLVGQSDALVDIRQVFQADDEQIVLNIGVGIDDDADDDYIEMQPIILSRDGASIGSVSFSIRPRHEGECRIQAELLLGRSKLQQWVLSFPVGPAPVEEPGRAKPRVRGRKLADSVAAPPTKASQSFSTNTGSSIDRVNIIINAVNQGYSILVLSGAQIRARLSLTPVAVDQMLKLARDELREICYARHDATHPYLTSIDIPPAIHQTALNRLAEVGALLYNDLFYASDDVNTAYIGDMLREYSARGSLRIQIVAENFSFPWLLLYDKELTGDADLEGFWGFRHQVECLPQIQAATPISFDPTIRVRSRLPMTFVANNALDEAYGAALVAAQREFFASLEKQLDLSTRSTKAELLADLNNADLPAQILYFYCLAYSMFPGEGSGTDSSMLLIDDLIEANGLTVQQMKIRANPRTQLKSAPLVFINAVQGGEMSALLYAGLVPYLMQKGARGVIGNEVEAPPLFAAEFARRFFQRFIAQEVPLGELLLELRREFAQKHNNLLGLLYAQYCNGDIVVKHEREPA